MLLCCCAAAVAHVTAVVAVVVSGGSGGGLLSYDLDHFPIVRFLLLLLFLCMSSGLASHTFYSFLYG